MGISKRSKGGEYISLDEAARKTKVYKTTLRKLAAQGKIKGKKEGRTEFVLLESLRNLFKG